MAKPAKLGRNDPCPCGSGRKYKDCHLPIHEAERAARLRLRQAHETLMPKLIEAAQSAPGHFPQALARFWGDRYTAEQLGELDELEERGAERFLAYFAFNHPLDDGRTLAETLADSPAEAGLDEHEAQLLREWAPARMRAYRAEAIRKGRGLLLRDLLAGDAFAVPDQAASRRFEQGELLVGHLVPLPEEGDAPAYAIAGAAAHLTADTADKLAEFAQLHLEAMRRANPGAGWDEFARERSYLLNHFVMALPVDAHDLAGVDALIQRTRASLGGVEEPGSSTNTPSPLQGEGAGGEGA
jgi:uncharacterized protein YecA (UPF0149 family)